jgi:hypothetical protein
MLFGDVTISSEDLATLLCRDVRAKVRKYPRNPNNRVRTAIVKEVLHREGTQRGYEVCIGDCHEWLLDLVWWKQSREGGIGIALAVECDWDFKDQMWDFQKLLCIKAPLKVFIYDGGNIPEQGRTERKQFEEEMLAYRHHVADETYLFISFGDTSQYSYRFVVPKDGALKTIHFETPSDIPTASYTAVP